MTLAAKGRIPAHLICAHEVGLQALRAEDVGHAAAGAADRLSEEPGRPPAASRRRRREGELDDSLDGLGGDRVVASSRLRSIGQALDARVHKAPPDPRHGFPRQVRGGPRSRHH